MRPYYLLSFLSTAFNPSLAPSIPVILTPPLHVPMFATYLIAHRLLECVVRFHLPLNAYYYPFDGPPSKSQVQIHRQRRLLFSFIWEKTAKGSNRYKTQFGDYIYRHFISLLAVTCIGEQHDPKPHGGKRSTEPEFTSQSR